MTEETRSKLERKKAKMRLGLYVLIALMVLEVFDVIAANYLKGSVTVLFVLAAINAAFIVYYYMHISTVLSDEGGH
ncbi:MAG: hypothetical protein GXP42_10175 [Chloroflexi bacterium]|nr:hypothetical protein [Chloroflexota bacterium]